MKTDADWLILIPDKQATWWQQTKSCKGAFTPFWNCLFWGNLSCWDLAESIPGVHVSVAVQVSGDVKCVQLHRRRSIRAADTRWRRRRRRRGFSPESEARIYVASAAHPPAELVLDYGAAAVHDCCLCPPQTCFILNLVFHSFNCHWSTYITLYKSHFPLLLFDSFSLDCLVPV